MKILILGGKRFIGYHFIAEALRRGHEVTLFNRGKTNPHLYPQVENIIGDRGQDLGRLDGRSFDAVIDTSCYLPWHMEESARYFAGKNAFYLLISTISVHDISGPTVNEKTRIPNVDTQTRTQQMDKYGAMKAGVETIARGRLGTDALAVVRPGFICGYMDSTDRMTYWPMKIYYQKEIIRPAGDFEFQLIDARDLAAFCLHLIEQRIAGDFCATGPEHRLMFSDFLRQCKAVANPECFIIPLSHEALDGCGLLKPSLNTYFPLWGTDLEGADGLYRVDMRKALANGLRLRPVAETIRAALDWYLEKGAGEDGALVGLKAKREREIIAGLNEAFRLRAE